MSVYLFPPVSLLKGQKLINKNERFTLVISRICNLKILIVTRNYILSTLVVESCIWLKL